MALSDEVRALAELLNTYLPLSEGQERIVDDRFVLWLGVADHPSTTVVQRLALDAGSVAPTVAEVRGLLRGRGRSAATWEVGPSSTPADLVERLQALGMRPDREPLAVGMVLDRAPSDAPGDVTARRVESLAEYVTASDIGAAGFGAGNETTEQRRARATERFAREQADGDHVTYLAWIGDEAVAFANAIYTDVGVVFSGGATLDHARGRGAYRALVHARWEDARRRGHDTVVTQAGAMSRPILRRVGFVEVCEVRILLDELRS